MEPEVLVRVAALAVVVAVALEVAPVMGAAWEVGEG